MTHFSKEYLELLAYKYKQGSLSDLEKKDFITWYGDLKNGEDVPQDAYSNAKVRMLENIQSGLVDFDLKANSRRKFPYQYLIAASLLLIGTVGLLVYRSTQNQQQQNIVYMAKPEARPGSLKAYLTISNGKKIELGDQAISSELNGIAKANANGVLVYAGGAEKPAAKRMNVLTVPKGGHYELVLNDGSHIWMNADSKLTYPEQFDKSERIVSLSGEAYFEVAHDAKRPFKVITESQDIEVLGTHFNISAYHDDPAAVTTLLQGSVKVKAGSKQSLIKPGQQAVTTQGNLLSVEPASAESALAWKNGMIEFENASLTQVMRYISRWYDVDVKFSGPQKSELFTGGVSRSSNLSSVLKILEASDVNFSMHVENGRKVLVIK